jgi:hypothetical protein
MLPEYINRLNGLNTAADIDALYNWFWQQRDLMLNEMSRLNEQYDLNGVFELKHDLPCLSVGSVRGLVLLSMNPGWSEKSNALEDSHCRSNAENYRGLMNNFFVKHPEVVGKRVRWWGKPFWFTRLLADYPDGFDDSATSVDKWQLAHHSKNIGGWELFPFHSQKDGVTKYIAGLGANQDSGLLRKCAIASVCAILRLRPKVLFVASKVGDAIVKDVLAENDSVIAKPIPNAKCNLSSWLIKSPGRVTEVLSIPYQIFSAPRKFTNQDILEAARLIRQERLGNR